jgi:hypothetical protein
MAALAGALLFLLCGIYLTRVGLPGFLQRPLLAELRAHGVDIELRRIRFRWFRGLVADDVSFGHENTNASITFRARSADLNFAWLKLLRREVELNRVAVHHGEIILKSGYAQPSQGIAVSDIESVFTLHSGDRWVLEDFRAAVAGADFIMSAEIFNATAIRDWDWFQHPTVAPRGSMRSRLKQLADKLEKISFASRPEFRLHLTGDGRDQQSFHVRLSIQAPEARTEWGSLTNAVLTAYMFPATSNKLARVEAELESERTVTPWADVSGFKLTLNLDSTPGVTNRVLADARLNAREVVTARARGTNMLATAHWVQSLTEAIPISGSIELSVDQPLAVLAGALQLRFRAGLSPSRSAAVTDPAWSYWAVLAPYRLDWQAEIAGLSGEQGGAENVTMSGLWVAPMLVVSNLHADLKDGTFDGNAECDVSSRLATFQARSSFDARQVRPFLRPRSREWLDKFSWSGLPPRITGSGAVVFPAWTNRAPAWRDEVLPTLRIAGEIQATNGAYLGIRSDWAHTHLTYTNQIWHLPDFRAERQGGLLDMEMIADDRTRDYLFRIRSSVDPLVLEPVLTPEAWRGLNFFQFTQAPMIEGEVFGRWREYERIGFNARVSLTNFTFRGQGFDSLNTKLAYTNRWLEVISPVAFRQTTQTLSADALAVDFTGRRIWFTNGFSTAEPMVVARCIGPRTAEGMMPYEFHTPPVVHVSGFSPLKTPGVAGLHFDVEGGAFSWWRFRVPKIAGHVRWTGDSIELSDMKLSFYGGDAQGKAKFALDELPGTDFSFFLDVQDARAEQLLPDVFPPPHTNHIEGLLSGMLSITNANSSNPKSWFGWSDFKLRDGLIWDMPVFGLFSDLVDTVTGMGRSRMSQASGRFGITNSVLRFDKVEMRAPVMRLQLRGAVDLEGNVDAIAEAEPLRDAWMIGPILRLTLKPITKFLEYKVTGTLAKPRREALYFPARVLTSPLRTIRTLDGLLESDKGTNSPAKPKSSDKPH